MDKAKLLRTGEIFDSYEKRFARARLDKPFSIPKSEEERRRIIEKAKKMLGYEDSLVPSVRNMREVSSLDMGEFTVTELLYETWDNVYSSASLYLPKREGVLPLVFLVCGHGDFGRLNKGYRLMATRLALMGLAVIVPDNIGQGDRELMGHWNSIGPFYAGTTLQGLIAMETVALVRHMKSDARFDSKRFAAIGNSGGGTLTLMLSALCP
jgi:cephalosporin-C deacetylase-like acetyl esterase